MSILSHIKVSNINSIALDESLYLQRLISIAKAPKSLYFIGNIPQNQQPTVAIVGTRKPSTYGREVAYKLAYDLARQGIIIVSGLAIGIDTIVHRAALDAGGTTIAVLAGGLDAVHPTSNRQLAEDIVKSGGALLSEFPAGIPPTKWQFATRNRIESGISDGVLIIEAAAKSGTMHTAQFARQQGRAVMAVPGDITNPMSEGANMLLKKGATVITSAADVLAVIKVKAPKQIALPGINNQEQVILRLLAQGSQPVDHLQEKTALDASALSQTLTMLELTGKVRLTGNRWGIV